MTDNRPEIQNPAPSVDGREPEPMSDRSAGKDEVGRQGNRASFWMRSRLELVVAPPCQAYLSTPRLSSTDGAFQAKDLLTPGPVPSDHKLTVEQHLRILADKVQLPEDQPLLALGMRNNLVNPRAMVCQGESVMAVAGEDPTRSLRPYYGVVYRDGAFSMDVWKPSDRPRSDFFCAGIPVLWDDMEPNRLFGLILTEASDHSHVFELPRGNHPGATDRSRQMWKQLHELFLENLHEDQATAEGRLREAMREWGQPPPREKSYLHSVVGTDADGNLVNIVAHGQLEDLGRAAAARGCRRAICVENSGSISPTFFPDGCGGPGVPLLRAPNFRPKGRAFLIIRLASPLFATLP